MKKMILIICMMAEIPGAANAQTLFVVKLLTSKIIRAIDLKVQQLQNEAINLQVLQKKWENHISLSSLSQIASWEQQQKDLYENYFKERLQIKKQMSLVTGFSDLMAKQKQLMARTRESLQSLYANNLFSPAERQKLASGAEAILSQSVRDLSRMMEILSPDRFSMGDAERLSTLKEIRDEMDQQETRLNTIWQKIGDLTNVRASRAGDIQSLKRVYGLK